MTVNARKLLTVYTMNLLVLHLCNLIFISIVLNLYSARLDRGRKYSGIDLKEFR